MMLRERIRRLLDEWRRRTREQRERQGRVPGISTAVLETAMAVREDDLGFAEGLKLAIPAGIIVWAALIGTIIHLT